MYCSADEGKEHILFDFPDEWGSLNIQELIRHAADFERLTEPVFVEIESPPDITDSDALSLVTHIKDATVLYDLNPRHWTSDLELKINNFIREPKIKLITIYYDERQLCVSYNFPKIRFVDLQYFMKIIDGVNLSVENFSKVIISSTIHGSIEDSLFLIMSRIYAPILYKLSTNHKYFDDWLHRRLTDYLIELAQLRTTLSGYISLYVPPEIGNINVDRASKNLSLVKRYNSIVMSWYVAIKDFLQELDEFVTDTDVSSPLDELEIWIYLYRNFCGIWSIFSSKTLGDVCKVLIEAQSNFVNLLFALAKPTKDAISITSSNIQYFQVLKEPFHELNKVNAPSEIILVLPRILLAIKFIWMNSPHYNKEVHLIKICCAVSNGIANFLMKFIDVTSILREKPNAGIKISQEICQTCKDYKYLYEKAVTLHNTHNSKQWPDIADKIFLNIDKLYDRCSDLIEVCNSVITFGRIDDEVDIPKPQFSWARSFELEKYVDGIENQYQIYLDDVKKYQDLILDLKSDEWKRCYARFKDRLLEIDTLIEDLMINAFSTVDNIEEGLEILQSLIKCSKRVHLMPLFEKFTVHLYELLLQESADAKKDALLEKSYSYPLIPRYGGRALVAFNKRNRLLALLSLLKNSTWLPYCVIENDVHKRCKLIIKYLDQILNRHYNKWLSLLPPNLEGYYNRPLLKVSKNSNNMIALNINRNFINTFQEAQYWSWLDKHLPESVETILGFTDNFYRIFSSAQIMILYHNKIMAELTGSEKLLFDGYITKLKAHISLGLVTNCDWSGETSLIFIKESLALMESFQTVIKYYKYKTFGIFKLTLHAAFRSFIVLPESFTFTLESFRTHLKEIRNRTTQRLHTCRVKIVEHLQYLEKLLEKNIADAKQYWGVFIYNVDLLYKDAMCSCVALSLENLLQFLQGSMYSRTGFIMIKIIEKEKKIEYNPSMLYLVTVIKDIFYRMLAVIRQFPSLLDEFNLKLTTKQVPYAAEVMTDEKCENFNSCIEVELIKIVQGLQTYAKLWLKFRDLWEVDRDVFLRKFSGRDLTLKDYSEEIKKYINLSKEIEGIADKARVHWVVIDATKLKEQLIQKCVLWHNEIRTNLAIKAAIKIEHVHKYCYLHTKRIYITPKTVKDIQELKQYFVQLRTENSKKDVVFAEIAEIMDFLGWYGFPFPGEMLQRASMLEPMWEKFAHDAELGEQMVLRAHEKYEDIVKEVVQKFHDEIKIMANNIHKEGPVTSNWDYSDALEEIDRLRKSFIDALVKEKKVLKELKIDERHSIENSHDFISAEKTLKFLEKIWIIKNNWVQHYEEYMNVDLNNLNNEEVELTIREMYENLLNMNNWPVVQDILDEMDKVRNILPLVHLMKDSALKPRHWAAIHVRIPVEFDETSEEFKVHSVFDLVEYFDVVEEVVETAKKELILENKIKEIKQIWGSTDFELEYFSTLQLYKICSLGRIYEQIKQHQTDIQLLKSSRYSKPFTEEVQFWDRNLITMDEIVQSLIKIQKSYMSFENFLTDGDLRKQLPFEFYVYEKLKSSWRSLTLRFYHWKNIFKIANLPELSVKLNVISKEVDHLYKTLDQYLNEIRHHFPRFSFLSNHGLFQTLCISDPYDIQYNTIFWSIEKLEMVREGSHYFGRAMISEDKEVVKWIKPILYNGILADWVNSIEDAMKLTLKEYLKTATLDLIQQHSERVIWAKNHCAQLCLTASKIIWTQECIEILVSNNPQKMLKVKWRNQIEMIENYIAAVRLGLAFMEKVKIVSLITTEIHNRDVLERLITFDCLHVNSYEWNSQMRFYGENDVQDCTIRQNMTVISYGYEYIGNVERIIITPLTERVFLSMTTALYLCRGSLSSGPTASGKTETVKELAKISANYFVVYNSPEGLDNKSLARILSGMAQTGAWICFEEASRVNSELLAVLTELIKTILNALSAKQNEFIIDGIISKLVPTLVISFNNRPATEVGFHKQLPNSLRLLLRPVSIQQPDSFIICENILIREGFIEAKLLAKKIFAIYKVSQHDDNKELEYNFGLRGLVALLKDVVKIKTNQPELSENEVILVTIKEKHMALMDAHDYQFVNHIVKSIFPELYPKANVNEVLLQAIKEECNNLNYQCTDILLQKAIHLYEMKCTRPAVIIMGTSATAKTATWTLLKAAMLNLKAKGYGTYQNVEWYTMNPAVLTIGEIYGEIIPKTNEWVDGIFSLLVKKFYWDKTQCEKWIIIDGPIDPAWAESLNSLMDESKTMFVPNGGRLIVPEQVSLIFEVENVDYASPSMVTRCGVMHNDHTCLKWQQYVQSWLNLQNDKDYVKHMDVFFKKYVSPLLKYKHDHCKEVACTIDIVLVRSLCKMLTIFIPPEKREDYKDHDKFKKLMELWFIFSATWSLGGALGELEKTKFSTFFKELIIEFPCEKTVFDYYVDEKVLYFKSISTLINMDSWSYDPSLPFIKNIPILPETHFYQMLCSKLLFANVHILLCGQMGSGRSYLLSSLRTILSPEYFISFKINMTSKFLPNQLEALIERRTTQISVGTFAPTRGRKLVVILDDFNITKILYNRCQPTHELIRQWMDYRFWYDRETKSKLYFEEVVFLVASNPCVSSGNQLKARVLSHFTVINIPNLTDAQMEIIFSKMLAENLKQFNESVRDVGEPLTKITIAFFKHISNIFLPKPATLHYIFTFRDILLVLQGLLLFDYTKNVGPCDYYLYWIHETYRTVADRLVDESEKELVLKEMEPFIEKYFWIPWDLLMNSQQLPLYCAFLNSNLLYEKVKFKDVKMYLDAKLEELNKMPNVLLNVILFNEAVISLCHISRIITLPRGHIIIVGVGGSGRKTLTRVASLIYLYKLYEISVSKEYNIDEFLSDIKKIYEYTGVKGKPATFILSDNELTEDTFWDVLCNFLGDGDIFATNGDYLFTHEEYEKIKYILKESAENEGFEQDAHSIYSHFIDRVRNNIRLVLSMNPIGDQFKIRLKQNPALLKCCSVLWNSEWPTEALLEVAQYCLTSFELPANILEGTETSDVKIYSIIPDDLHNKLCVIFSKIYESLTELTLKMIAEKKQYIYISLERYLDFISQFKIELFKKRRDFWGKRNALSEGLFKLKVVKTQHEILTIEYTNNTEEITAISKECELFIGEVQTHTIELNELIASIAEHVEQLKQAEEIYNDKLDAAMADLKPVTPAYEAAVESLIVMNKEDLEEIENFEIPPYNVELVLNAIMVLLELPPTWEEARVQISDIDFLEKLINFEKDNVSDEVLSKLNEYIYNAYFDTARSGAEGLAAQTLANWVLAIQSYATAYKYVRPRIQALNDKELNDLHVKQDQLNYTQYEIENLEALVAHLKNKYQERVVEKNILLKKAELLKGKLEIGNDLISSLADEQTRWIATIEKLDVSLENLSGDCIFLAAYTIYLGPFLSSFRNRFITLWKTFLNESKVPFTENVDVSSFELNPSIIKEWNDNGLPVDKFSIENAMIIKKSVGWPLIIDPHLQAWKWLETMESPFFLKVIEFGEHDVLGSIESSMGLGIPVILRNLREHVDPALLPVLKKIVVVKGNSLKFKLGKRLVNYNRNFRFYMVTRIKNPNFPPEISMKTSVVNFSLNKHGLEPQLLNVVMNIENPLLQARKKKQTEQIVLGKRRLDDFELTLLKYLDKCDETLFDKPKLLKKLKDSISEVKMANIELSLIEKETFETDKNVLVYIPCAVRATLILLILDDLLNIDPMYKFSFSDYVEFLKDCIKKSPPSKDITERMDLINEYFTYTVYKRACCTIFKKHQLILSFLICTKLLSSQDIIQKDGINFLLKGNGDDTLDISNEPINPAKDWLPDELWYNLCALVKNVSEFPDILSSFSENVGEWKIWYECEEPENLPFIDIVENLCQEFHRVLIIRALRKDRLLHAIRNYVEINIGNAYVAPYVTNLKEIFAESTVRTPILFIKSSESVDPTPQILQLADELNIMRSRVYIKKIGEGQEQVTKRIIEEGLVYGFWIFIADCQNLIPWTPELRKIIEGFKTKQDIHRNFRLWLSSVSHPDFPISILRSSVKIVIEEPEGLKWHMKSIYSNMTDMQLNPFPKSRTYQKLLFALTFFHSQILIRKKFFTVGCFGNFDFLTSDFEDSQKLLASVLKENTDKVPWNILKNFIAETFYGGSISTWWGQSVISSYFDDLFNENAIQPTKYRMTSLPQYYIPSKGGPTFTEYLNMLPDDDRPEVFGLDSNSSVIINSKKTIEFCETLLSLEMDVSMGGPPKKEEIVMDHITEILQKIPPPIAVKRPVTSFITPLRIVLNKEIAIYNKLLAAVIKQLNELVDGLNGLLSMDDFLNHIFRRIYENRIPKNWSDFYPTSKSLSAWVEDLALRVNYIEKCDNAKLPLPEPHWLSAYICPTRILMAILQEAAINIDVQFDQLTWEFIPREDILEEVPSEGILVRGMFVKGAGWDPKKLVLVDAPPLQYVSQLSIIHFKPVLKTEKLKDEDMFKCPVFYCSIEKYKDICKEVHIFDIELNRGSESCGHWIKRGTAAFLGHSNL